MFLGIFWLVPSRSISVFRNSEKWRFHGSIHVGNENISKIEQLFRSEKPEAGFELLKTINKPELNEALADSIQSTVKEKYFEPSYSLDPPGVGEGLDLLRSLIPNLTSLDLSGSYIEELDLEKFINLNQTKNEVENHLEQLRALENNITIMVALAKSSPIGIDTKEDYIAIKKIMEYKS